MSPSGVKIRLSVTFSSFGVGFSLGKAASRRTIPEPLSRNHSPAGRPLLQSRAATPMKIFQILEFNQFNTGSVHQMFQAASGLRERGHEVTIVSRPDAVLAARAAEKDVRFHGLPFRHQFDLDTIRRLRRLIREERPDVIHVHKGIAHGLAMAATWRADHPSAHSSSTAASPFRSTAGTAASTAPRASIAWSRSAGRSKT